MVYLCGNEAAWETVTLDLWVFSSSNVIKKEIKEPK